MKTEENIKDFEQKTVGYNTYEKIKHDIIYGVLKPSSKLKLEFLNTQYGASNSTLREILNRLTSENFVVAEEQRGFFVAPVSKTDFIEIAKLRILIESHALEESIENGDTEWEAQVVSAYHKLSRMEKKMGDGNFSEVEVWKRYDWEFHQATIKACNSKNLLILHKTIFEKYLRYQLLVLNFRGEPAALEHKNLFEAVLDRDISLSQKLLHDHIKNGWDHVINTF